MTKIGGICLFGSGVAVGAVLGHYISTDKVKNVINKVFHRQEVKEEVVETVEEEEEPKVAVVWNHHNSEEKEEEEEPDPQPYIPKDKTNIFEYASKLKEENYINYAVTSKPEPKNTIVPDPADISPYVISPAEFGERDDFDTASLTCFKDDIVVDEGFEVIDISELVGADALKHFGEYEEDSVFVRNERLRCDYEILLDTRTYEEALRADPGHYVK